MRGAQGNGVIVIIITIIICEVTIIIVTEKTRSGAQKNGGTVKISMGVIIAIMLKVHLHPPRNLKVLLPHLSLPPMNLKVRLPHLILPPRNLKVLLPHLSLPSRSLKLPPRNLKVRLSHMMQLSLPRIYMTCMNLKNMCL